MTNIETNILKTATVTPLLLHHCSRNTKCKATTETQSFIMKSSLYLLGLHRVSQNKKKII